MQKMRLRILFGFANFLLSVNPTAYAHGRKSLSMMDEHKIIQNKTVSILFKCSSSYCFVVLIRMCFIIFAQSKRSVWMLILKKIGGNFVDVCPVGDCRSRWYQLLWFRRRDWWVDGRPGLITCRWLRRCKICAYLFLK